MFVRMIKICLGIILGFFLFITNEVSAQNGPVNNSPSNGEFTPAQTETLTVTDLNAPPPSDSSAVSNQPAGDKGSAAVVEPPVAVGKEKSDRPFLPGNSFFSQGRDIIKAVGAFILVMVLLVAALKIIGRLGRGGLRSGGKTFVLKGTMALDNRRYLAAVEIDGRMLIVGVTPERLTSLGQWSLTEKNNFEAKPERTLAPLKNETVNKTVSPKSLLKKEGRKERKNEDNLDFTLTLDEEEFDGPETNDDFLGLDYKRDIDER